MGLWDWFKTKNCTKVLFNIQVNKDRELSLKKIYQGKSKKRIYLTIIIISRISSIVYTEEKQKIENVY